MFMIDQKIEKAEVKGEAARPPLPPFTKESATQKVRLAEDAWNTRDPQKVALAYTPDSRWRNRAEFPNGREEIIQFLTRKGDERTRLSPDQRALGFRGKPYRCSLRLRMARRLRTLVPFLRQRELGVCGKRFNATSPRFDQ
jgi:hypothetical protein